MNIKQPVVIAHRGASGYMPEHTLEGYRLAISQGADFIEPDLVPTKDGVLVCRHENNITDTTNVGDRVEFSDRKATKVIDGETITGWFTEDFTLDELKSLRARGRNALAAQYNDQFQVPTFQEVIDLAKGFGVGLYPEVKHSTYFSRIGQPTEEPLVAQLQSNGLDSPDAKVCIQSFEVSNLKKLSQMTAVKLVQLIWNQGKPEDWVQNGDPRTYADMVTPEGVAEIATYADIIAPHKEMVNPALISDSHQKGLEIHPYTFSAENKNLPAQFQVGDDPDKLGDLTNEVRQYFAAGVDGVFCNHPDLGVAAKPQLAGSRR